MRRTRRHAALELILSSIVVLGLLAGMRTAVGQAKDPGCQRPAADSLQRVPRHPLWPPFVAAIITAPSGILLPMGCSDTMTYAGGPVPVRNFELTLSASAGLADDYAHSENVELRDGKLYLGFRSSHQDPNTALAYRTARIGALLHRADYFEGGVSAGYRFATERDTHGGPELAFPFRVTGRHWSLLLESSYVFGGQTFWNYRLECDYPLRAGPLFAGWLVDANEFPIRRTGRIRTVAVGVVLGVRR